MEVVVVVLAAVMVVVIAMVVAKYTYSSQCTGWSRGEDRNAGGREGRNGSLRTCRHGGGLLVGGIDCCRCGEGRNRGGLECCGRDRCCGWSSWWST